MKVRTTLFSVLPLVALLGATAVQEPANPKEAAAKPAAMKAPMPGPHHAAIKKLEGTWDATVKSQMDPTAPAQESKGVVTCKVACNGLWCIDEYKGDMAGQPFEGHGLAGYDSTKKKHVRVWINSMQDFIMTSEGECDGTCKKETSWAEATNPETGKKDRYKEIREWKDADNRVFTMSTIGADGKETTVLTINYKRRK